jgi:hypothetical protein
MDIPRPERLASFGNFAWYNKSFQATLLRGALELQR